MQVFRYRKIHRWIAIVIGVQLLMWTISGIYFSWTDLDEIHGDFTRAEVPLIPIDEQWVSPTVVLEQVPAESGVSLIESVELIRLGSTTLYRIVYLDSGDQEHVALADAETGAIRGALTESEAVDLARASFSPESEISEVIRLEEGDVGPHHEYRGRPLPAYRISFEHPSNMHVFVAVEYGQVSTHRNAKWRVFDFLWMLHTMDYVTRDNFNNPLLRAVSVAALIMAMSGYVLWWKTRKRRRRHAA